MRQRSLVQKLFLVLGFFLAFTATRLQVAIDDSAGALPLELTLTGLPPAQEAQVQVFALNRQGRSRIFTHLRGTAHWKQGFELWTRRVRLYLPSEALEKPYPLTLHSGDQLLVRTDTQTLARTWQAIPKPAGNPSPLVAFDSPIALNHFPGILNGPEPGPFVELGGRALGLLSLGLGLVWLTERYRGRRPRALRVLWLCLQPQRAGEASLYPAHTERRVALVGLILLAIGLLVLTKGRRYGFVHDDNLSQFLPVILQGCSSLFDHGVFPTYNPYQLLGAPTATIGTYALTYPPTYLSYALARWGLGDPNQTLDVFALLHLALGYLATFTLARRLGLRPSLALSVALSFVLCGYFCVYTRSWFYMAPVALWTPLLLLHLTELTSLRPLTWRWPVSAGLAIGLYFHAGNAQMWTYTLMLAGALVGLWQLTGRLPKHRWLWALAGLAIGLALAAPLLLPQSAEIAPTDREGSVKSGILRGVMALVLPTPLVHAAHPTIEDGAPRVWRYLLDFSPLYFCGPVFVGMSMVALATLPFLRWRRRMLASGAWLLCGALAFVLALGEEGGLAQLLAALPGLNKLQHWWKFLPFVALFFSLSGGLILERWLRLTKNTAVERATLVLTPLLLLYNAALSRPMMTLPEPPYPALPPPLHRTLQTGQEPTRAIALAPWQPEWHEPGLVSASLSQNFATVYQVPMLEGYDPLVAKSPLNLRVTDRLYFTTTLKRSAGAFDPLPTPEPRVALQRYGVRWALLTDGYDELKGTHALEETLQMHGQLRQTLGHTRLIELPPPDSLAFPEAEPRRALPLTLSAEGVKVALPEAVSGPVILNFLAREALRADADGNPLPIERDAWDRVRVIVPSGAQTLTLRYVPAWGRGLAASAVLLALATALTLWLHRRT